MTKQRGGKRSREWPPTSNEGFFDAESQSCELRRESAASQSSMRAGQRFLSSTQGAQSEPPEFESWNQNARDQIGPRSMTDSQTDVPSQYRLGIRVAQFFAVISLMYLLSASGVHATMIGFGGLQPRIKQLVQQLNTLELQ